VNHPIGLCRHEVAFSRPAKLDRDPILVEFLHKLLFYIIIFLVLFDGDITFSD